VTVQRVSLWRGSKTVEDVWKFVHGQNGRRWADDALKQRGERGIRVADFNYRKARLELGMLKGNAFVITLRYAKTMSISAYTYSHAAIFKSTRWTPSTVP
jgi:tRNA pseudouridine13 synthase